MFTDSGVKNAIDKNNFSVSKIAIYIKRRMIGKTPRNSIRIKLKKAKNAARQIAPKNKLILLTLVIFKTSALALYSAQ